MAELANGAKNKTFAKSTLGKGKLFAILAIAAFMVMMLLKPSYYLDSARRGLALYATSVLPSLFPFYFCSLLLTNLGAARTVAGVFGKPVKVLFGAPRSSAYVLLLSMLSGYPVGASMTAELYSAGAITKKEAKTIAAFASTSGPIFMLGTVGSAIFHDVKIGVMILISHYIAALINGLIFRMRSGKNDERANILSNIDHDDLMAKTISNATLNMLYVGGYIVLCGMLVDTLPLIGVDRSLTAALGYDASRPVLAILYGAIEMTRGSIASAECAYLPLSTAISAGIISFGGLSVTLQNYTFLSRCGMKFGEILLRKLCHCAIAAVLAFSISALFSLI